MGRSGRRAIGVRDQHLRGSRSRPATVRQLDVLAAYVASGGSIPAELTSMAGRDRPRQMWRLSATVEAEPAAEKEDEDHDD